MAQDQVSEMSEQDSRRPSGGVRLGNCSDRNGQAGDCRHADTSSGAPITWEKPQGDVDGDPFAVTPARKFTPPPRNLAKRHIRGKAERYHRVVKDKSQTTISRTFDLHGLHETLRDMALSRKAKSTR
jgi:hypothetical protein